MVKYIKKLVGLVKKRQKPVSSDKDNTTQNDFNKSLTDKNDNNEAPKSSMQNDLNKSNSKQKDLDPGKNTKKDSNKSKSEQNGTNKGSSEQKDPNKGYSEEELKTLQISSILSENIEKINEILGVNTDLVIRNFTLGRTTSCSGTLIYLDNMVSSVHIDDDIVRPLVLDVYTSGLDKVDKIIEQLQAGNLITRGQVKTGKNIYDLLDGIVVGDVGLLIDGVTEVFIINAPGYGQRAVATPDVEPVVKGPKEAFIEALSVNIGLIRKRIHSPNLIFESLEIGTLGKTKVCMAYIRGLCPAGLSKEVRSRLERISIDGVLESGYIEEFIEDNPYSLFPQIRNTERPDVVAASLMEGRVAIIIDNTPVALIVPGEFLTLIQSAEDYYNKFMYSSLIRILRYFSLLIAILLPSLYIAVTNFHQEMLPTDLLVSIISARSHVPFPAFLEALIMEFVFEIIREAGVRLPRPLGQAVSIVGALVIGQAAVQASIVSPLMVIIVALTGIATFTIPQYNISLPIRILRFFLMILSAVFGLFGVMIGVLFLMLHLFSLESFGKPYMAPLSPLRTSDLKDSLLRLPWWSLVKRPANSSLNSNRMEPGQKPHPPKKGGSKK